MITQRAGTLLAALAVVAAGASVAQAQFDLSWHTIDGGGATFSVGGGFELGGTIGQPDAGVVMSGGSFQLIGGFWAGVGSTTPPVCPGDLTGDNQVSLNDLTQLLAHFGTGSGAVYTDGDVEPPGGDGDVDLNDLSFLLSRFGTICQ